MNVTALASCLQDGKCLYSVEGKAAYCSSFHILPAGDELALQAAVASVGPIAVAVNAMLSSFHLYKGGETNDWCSICITTQLLLVNDKSCRFIQRARLQPHTYKPRRPAGGLRHRRGAGLLAGEKQVIFLFLVLKSENMQILSVSYKNGFLWFQLGN